MAPLSFSAQSSRIIALLLFVALMVPGAGCMVGLFYVDAEKFSEVQRQLFLPSNTVPCLMLQLGMPALGLCAPTLIVQKPIPLTASSRALVQGIFPPLVRPLVAQSPFSWEVNP